MITNSLFVCLGVVFALGLNLKSRIVVSLIVGSLMSAYLINTYQMPSELLVLNQPPRQLLPLVAFISTSIIVSVRGNVQTRSVDAVALGAGVISLVYMSQMNYGLQLTPGGGPHWVISARALLGGSLSLGDVQLFDVAWYNGHAFVPYGIGTSLMTIFFAEWLKLAIPVLIVAAIYIYVRISTIVWGISSGLGSIALFLFAPFMSAVALSGTFYPYPILGSTVFIGLAILSCLEFANSKTNRKLIQCALFIFLASLFRFEAIVVAVPIVAYLVFVLRRVITIAPIWLSIILSTAAALTQNKIKFDDPFQGGIGWNNGIQDPKFKTWSVSHFIPNVNNYFFSIPDVSLSFPHRFRFPFTCPRCSEPGGYLTVKYPFIFLALLMIFAVFVFGRFLNYEIDKFLKVRVSLVFLAGIGTLFSYLFVFASSPKYEMLYMPLLIVLALPMVKRYEKAALVFAIATSIANYFAVYSLVAGWESLR